MNEVIEEVVDLENEIEEDELIKTKEIIMNVEQQEVLKETIRSLELLIL